MTVEEAREMFGIPARGFYVSCTNCPLNIGNKCPGYNGYEECWKALAMFMTNNEAELDIVNHPSHYETGKFECIDVMCEAIGVDDVKGFCLCNAFKYIYRCTKKHDTPTEDVKKAIWYLKKFLELEGESE